MGTAAVLIPLATDTASGAVEQVIGQLIGDVSGSSVDEHAEKMEDLTDLEKKKVYSAGESMAEAPLGQFAARQGIALDSELGEALYVSMLTGYGTGNDREDQQGNAPETG